MSGRGWLPPEKIKVAILKKKKKQNKTKQKNNHCMVLKLTLYIRNVISFSHKRKTRWNYDTWNCLESFQFSVTLAYISLKIGYFEPNHDYDVILTSYLGCRYLIWYVWRERKNKDSLFTLYNTLVLSYLSYCTIVWGYKNKSNWRCSGRSSQVPFWRKWVIDGFEVVMGQKIFWQNFGQFGPFPVRVTHTSSRGQNFKMLEITFHVYYSWGCKDHKKIYSLLRVGCMVREILTKGHPKVKWGQIFSNIRFAWMTYQIIPLSLHIPKIYTFRLFELSLLK